MSKTKIMIHTVISTKYRERTINPDKKEDLYKYINGIIRRNNCHPIEINGIADHIHLLFDLNPTVKLSDLIKSIKIGSGNWLKTNADFRFFRGWGKGYYAVSVGRSERERCEIYIRNQEQHHTNRALMEELRTLIRAYELEWFPDDWS